MITRLTAPALALGVVAVLGGCTYPPDPDVAAAAGRPVTCSSATECNVMWARAVAWVAANAPYRIDIQTDDLIQTFGPFEDSGKPGVQVSRVMNADGSGSINFMATCYSGLFGGCYPNPIGLKGRFSMAVQASGTR